MSDLNQVMFHDITDFQRPLSEIDFRRFWFTKFLYDSVLNHAYHQMSCREHILSGKNIGKNIPITVVESTDLAGPNLPFTISKPQIWLNSQSEDSRFCQVNGPLRRFLIFAEDSYYPNGELTDLVGSFDELEQIYQINPTSFDVDNVSVIDSYSRRRIICLNQAHDMICYRLCDETADRQYEETVQRRLNWETEIIESSDSDNSD